MALEADEAGSLFLLIQAEAASRLGLIQALDCPMNNLAPVSTSAATNFCALAFSVGSPTVVESYSSFDEELQWFGSANSLASYVEGKRAEGAASVQISFYFPDTGGALSTRRIALDSSKSGGATFRYEAQGWGLVLANIELLGSAVGSFVSANSEKRAAAWASTYPDLGSPQQWHWPAVSRHLRRLRRALAGAI